MSTSNYTGFDFLRNRGVIPNGNPILNCLKGRCKLLFVYLKSTIFFFFHEISLNQFMNQSRKQLIISSNDHENVSGILLKSSETNSDYFQLVAE